MPMTERERTHFDALRAEGWGIHEALRQARLMALEQDVIDAKIWNDTGALFGIVERLLALLSQK